MANPPPSGSKPVKFSNGDSEDDQQPKLPQNACSICSAPLGNDGDIYVHKGNLFCSEACRTVQIVLCGNSNISTDTLAQYYRRLAKTDDKATVRTASAPDSPDSLRETCHLCNEFILQLEKPEFGGRLFCSEVCRKAQILIEDIKQQIVKDPLAPISLSQPVTDDKATSSNIVETTMASTSSSAPDPIYDACHLCNFPIVKIEQLEFKGHHFCSGPCRRSHQLVDAMRESYPLLPRTTVLDDDEDSSASSSDADETDGEVTN